MAIWTELRPATFFKALRAIDEDAAKARSAPPGSDRRPAIALLTAALCLLLIHYLKFDSRLHDLLAWLSQTLGHAPGDLSRQLAQGLWSGLLNEAWWALWHGVGYVLIPVLVIKFLYREPVRDYGLRFVGLRSHGVWYLALFLPIFCFVILASFREDFGSHYPFYPLASRSWVDLLAWEALYLTQFVCLEFFFRGFLLNSLKTAFGANAIFIMALPYMMIHFPKPWLEASGAILFGIFLGVLALRSRSIWGGVAVHAGVAVSMDIAALLQTRGLPTAWWP